MPTKDSALYQPEWLRAISTNRMVEQRRQDSHNHLVHEQTDLAWRIRLKQREIEAAELHAAQTFVTVTRSSTAKKKRRGVLKRLADRVRRREPQEEEEPSLEWEYAKSTRKIDVLHEQLRRLENEWREILLGRADATAEAIAAHPPVEPGKGPFEKRRATETELPVNGAKGPNGHHLSWPFDNGGQ